MTKNNKLQVILVFVGLCLLIFTYLLYPKIVKDQSINKNKLVEIENKKKEMDNIDNETSNTFTNVEYGGLYDFENPFTVKAEEAHILKDDVDIVYMNQMEVVLEMKNGKVWTIVSDKGSYNKVTYDCYFEQNVKATDNETLIVADNLNLLASKDVAIAYNNVYLTNDNGSLRADKINYDFETMVYTVNMWSANEKIKAKIIQ